MRFAAAVIVLAAVLAVACAQDGSWSAPIYVEPVCPKTIKYVCGFKEVQGPYGMKYEYKTFDNRCKLDAENSRVYHTLYKPLIKIEGYTCADLGY